MSKRASLGLRLTWFGGFGLEAASARGHSCPQQGPNFNHLAQVLGARLLRALLRAGKPARRDRKRAGRADFLWQSWLRSGDLIPKISIKKETHRK